MKLLQSITIITLLFSTTVASAQWGKHKKIKGDSHIITTTVSTGTYDAISAAGAMDFKLIEGTEGEISIKGDSNLISYIVTEVKQNTLHIKIKKGYNIKPSQTIVITIPYESISAISLAGSGDITNTGTIKTTTFKVALAGSGDIDLNVSAEEIESKIAGSGDIELKGITTQLSTVVAGSGDFDGDALKSTNVMAKISGSGDINVHCNGELTVKIAGSGDVKYSGQPTKKNTSISGSGSVSH
ncbi:head GIN domain-containing protein [Winogradskyella sediminis]|uniref:head GIN domain-containing protein n=1 Tax=Winogradskyella sediminis TaxID=1382466 RepID=UPI000E27FDEE|nr:head GIN domain-containing protein [Winogradskyella sediminis]REG85975.1 putative autotransporter adhesin-like protein [Winogradskyella sediminis]